MLDLAKSFSVDETKENEGVWEDLGGGAAILVARINNKNYLDEFKSIPRGLRRLIENETIEEDHQNEIFCELIAKTILIGWKGMADEGKSVNYSVENAKKMLIKYPEFRIFVWNIANDFQRFHRDSVEEDAKN